MRRPNDLLSLITIAGTLALAGCAQISVYAEHDSRVRFDELTGYDWLPEDGPDGTAATHTTFDDRIRAAVDETLAARGLERRTDGTADLVVGYTISIESDVRSVTLDRYYGYRQSAYLAKSGSTRDYPRSTLGRETAAAEYEQGALVLDFSSPTPPRRSIWRAYGRTVLDPGSGDAQREQRLMEALRRMLAEFPP
jgi:hypothetical protein